MRILSIVHGSNVPAGVFGDEAERGGHEVDTWSLAWGTPPPAPIDDYGAVMIFGGAMHADQDDRHPWLREENFFLQRLLDIHIPVLGVCLGAQLIAKAAHAEVTAMSEPEVGWVDVELTDEAADDPLFSGLPERFPAFQWHYYEFAAPSGAQVLARSDRCTQAFRLGDMAWGVQFHPEVTRADPRRVVRRRARGDSRARRRRCSPSSIGKPTAGKRSGEGSAATSSRPPSASRSPPSARPAAPRGGSTRARTPRSCARGSRRRAARSSPGRTSTPSGST